MSSNHQLAYLDNLDINEITFLTKQAQSAKSSFLKITHHIFLIIFVLLALLYTIANFTYDPNNISPDTDTPLSPLFVLQLSGIILLLFVCILSAAYYLAIFGLFQEIKKGKKVVAQVKIKEKKHMAQNDSYHLFLLQSIKKSIEVDAAFFHHVSINDEINIEYMPTSEKVLGYH